MAYAKDEDDLERIMATLLRGEKAWLLSRIGLIPDLDDDVMDEVRFHIILSCKPHAFYFWVLFYLMV